ncbi:MAG: hypothetical protein ABFS21_11150 [Actinomycetota bacterium]
MIDKKDLGPAFREFGTYLAKVLALAFAVPFIAAIVFVIWFVVASSRAPDWFDHTANVQIGSDGYGAIRITSTNLKDGELEVYVEDGYAFIHGPAKLEQCHPCEWEVYVVHSSKPSVHVTLEILGHQIHKGEYPFDGTTIITPSPLPPAAVDSIEIDVERSHTPDIISIDSTVGDATAKVVFWDGTLPRYEFDISSLPGSCPRRGVGPAHRQTDFVIVPRKGISGTLTVLNIGEAAPHPELVVTRPQSWEHEFASRRSAEGPLIEFDVLVADEFDPCRTALVVEAKATKPGWDAKTVPLEHDVPDVAAETLGPNDVTHGPHTKVIACDEQHCGPVLLNSPFDEYTWTATLQWAFFDPQEDAHLPTARIDVKE